VTTLHDPSHETFFDLALAEAAKCVGRTHPNPPVGAVLVRDGVVVGRGHTRPAGGPHAEVEALREAGPRARGADMYVTLEPHDHLGRTPPCSVAMVEAGVGRVFLGSIDPNPLVSGRGVKRLENAGIPVRAGLRAEASAKLLQAFATHITTGLPFVVLKIAATLDGRIATKTGQSKWITGEPARALVHRWRDEFDAVLVGAGTVAADDPLLTTRLAQPAAEGRPPRNPVRVVMSTNLRLSASAQIFDTGAAPTLVYTRAEGSEIAARLRARGVEVVGLPGEGPRIDPRALAQDLGRRGFTSLLVEGGAEVHASLLKAGVVDEIRLFLAPKIIGGDGLGWIGALGVTEMADAVRLTGVQTERVGEDVLVTARLQR
jgi:diaminohydroxyphosphoribosylaminopyrimidine deaminase/5-amino-6-(5-phosphoribosylamino)uracil reductase